MSKIYLTYILTIITILTIKAQNHLIQNSTLRTFTHKTNQQFNIPFIAINSTTIFGFDIIGESVENYKYKITPCNIDWTPSNLNYNLFLEGSSTYTIYELENSLGTLTNYTHYTFKLPNAQTKITRTGNYIISIINENGKELASKKLIVYSLKAGSKTTITPSNEASKYQSHQRIQFSIATQNLPLNFPSTEIKPIIYKNNDLNIHSKFLVPTYTQDKLLLYDGIDAPEFNGGNEFLNFDSNDLLRTTDKIASFYKQDNIIHHVLYPNQNREESIYTYNPDINGNYIIRNQNDYNTDTESDYSLIEFSFNPITILKHTKPIYIYGGFNNFELNEENLLKYNENNKTYATQILMKQGFYNYTYITIDHDSINEIEFNGSHIETENEYQLIIYYTPNNSLFYEVVGFENTNSKEFIQ